MKRLLPASLLGQVMLVLAIGLLAAQGISAALLFQASENRRETALVSSIAFRVIAEQNRAERLNARPGDRRLQDRAQRRAARRAERARGMGDDDGPPLTRRLRLRVERSETAPVSAGERRLSSYEATLREMLEQQEMIVGDIRVTRRQAADDPFVVNLIQSRPAAPPPDWRERKVLIAAVERPGSSGWLTVRQAEPPRGTGGLTTILLQTLVILIVLMSLLYLLLRRITRPLAELTGRVDDFSRQPGRVVRMEERGPSDTRRLIAAHNAMESRIAALLDEKDVMLGAIGHDLKTPLAALRVRIESVPDETQRQKMADSIEDITATLDDILTLTRIGRDGSGREAVDLGKLALGVVEEFEDLGDPVTISNPPRLVARVQVTWIRRALRNLVSNAVRYGDAARISVFEQGGMAVLRIEDDGSGIPEDQIGEMLEPFTRGEASRNRTTGGAGLGLTLARAIAEQHGGELVLSNRSEGGLRAEIRLPVG